MLSYFIYVTKSFLQKVLLLFTKSYFVITFP